MTIKYFKYCSRIKVPCATQVTPSVIICLESADLIVQPDPECGLPITYIEAEICQAYVLSDECCNPVWTYRFSYDDEQLTNPDVTLSAGDVTGFFCKDCLTDWVEELISCITVPSVCVVPTDTIEFALTEDNCVTGDVNISADVGNAIEAHADGLYAAEESNDWHILGNTGTDPATNFVGTIDAEDLVIRVENIPTYRYILAPEDIATDSLGELLYMPTLNVIEPDEDGFGGNAILSGGGEGSSKNQIINGTDEFNTHGRNVIVGGYVNTIEGSFISVIGGGWQNYIHFGDTCGILSGEFNFIGYDNSLQSSYPFYDTIAGGLANLIVGGSDEFGYSRANTISGGQGNQISVGAGAVEWNTIAGGFDNLAAGGSYNSIGGGRLISMVGSYNACPGGAPLVFSGNSFGFQRYMGVATPRDLSAFSNIAYFGDCDVWVANSNGTATKLKLIEPNTDLDFSSAHYTSHQAQAQAANIEYVWPATAGVAGQSLKIQSVVGVVVTLEWA